MKTIQDFKNLLYSDDYGYNTTLGMHLNHLINNKYCDLDVCAYTHDLELKVEVIVQLHKNGINSFNDRFPLGSGTKAYYQYMLNQYSEY